MSHTYSRTQSLLKEFAQSTQSADIIILNKIYSSARENAADFNITGKTLYEETVKCNSKDKVFYYEESTDALDFVCSLIEEPVSSQYPDGYILVTMGAGDNWKLGTKLIESYK